MHLISSNSFVVCSLQTGTFCSFCVVAGLSQKGQFVFFDAPYFFGMYIFDEPGQIRTGDLVDFERFARQRHVIPLDHGLVFVSLCLGY